VVEELFHKKTKKEEVLFIHLILFIYEYLFKFPHIKTSIFLIHITCPLNKFPSQTKFSKCLSQSIIYHTLIIEVHNLTSEP